MRCCCACGENTKGQMHVRDEIMIQQFLLISESNKTLNNGLILWSIIEIDFDRTSNEIIQCIQI